MTDGKQVGKIADELRTGRGSYRNLCDEVSKYFAPEMEMLYAQAEGEEILQPIDGHAISALGSLVRGLHSNSMSLDKGNIIDADPDVMENPYATEWYGEFSDLVEHHIEQSDMINKFMQWLEEFCAFGGAVMYMEWNATKQKHDILVYPIKDTYYTFDAKGSVDAVYRDYEFTASQAVKEFGESKVAESIKTAYKQRDLTKKFRFVHCMRERMQRDPSKTDAANMPYESIHIFRDDASIVKESGSQQFRYIIKHFYQKIGELSGRSPCMQALPSARTLMDVNALHYDGTELALLPPLFLPDRNAVESVRMEAGSVNYADLSKGNPWSLNTDPRVLAYSADTIDRLQKQIDEALFVDLFRAILDRGSPQMTAFQTNEMVAERTQALAPIANTLSGFFEDAITITALDLRASGMIPEAPAGLEPLKLKVKYTSRLDIRLKQVEVSATREAITQMVEFNIALDQAPAVDATFNRIETCQAFAESFGVPTKLTRNAKEAQKRLDELNSAAAEAQQQENMAQTVKPLDLQARSDPESPMGAIEAGAGGSIRQ